MVGKLIRDKIPDIIRRSGRAARVTMLPEDAFRAALLEKLHEEVAELIAAQTTESILEEAADVLEVVTALVAMHGATLDDVGKLARRKRLQRGGFDERLWLDGIDDDPQHDHTTTAT